LSNKLHILYAIFFSITCVAAGCTKVAISDKEKTSHIQTIPDMELCSIRTDHGQEFLKCEDDPEEYQID